MKLELSRRFVYHLLTSPTTMDEVAFTAIDSNGAPRDVLVNEKIRVTNANRVALRSPANDRYGCTASKVPWHHQSLIFGVTEQDANGAYGWCSVKGRNVNWCVQHNDPHRIVADVKDLIEKDGEIHGLSPDEKLALTVYPTVVAVAYGDAEMDPSIFDDSNATVDQYVRYCEEYYYKYLQPHKDDEVVTTVVPGVISHVKISNNVITAKPACAKYLSDAYFAPSFSMEDARAGKYRLPFAAELVTETDKDGAVYSYDFAKDVRPLSFLDDFVSDTIFVKICTSFKGYIETLLRKTEDYDGSPMNDFFRNKGTACWTRDPNIFLFGPPAGGKNTMLRAMSAIFGLPLCEFNIDENAEKDELTRTTKVGKSGYTLQYSPMYWYVKYGGIFCIDDVSNARQNMLFGVTGQVTEAPFQLRIDDTKVSRNPLTVMTATCNVGTQDTHRITEALAGRWGIIRKVMPQGGETFIRQMMNNACANTGIAVNDTIQKVAAFIYNNIHMKVYETVHDIDPEAADNIVTLRQAELVLEEVIKALAVGGHPDIKDIATDAYANVQDVCSNQSIAEDIRGKLEQAKTFKL